MRSLLRLALVLALTTLGARAGAQAEDLPARLDLTICAWEYRLEPGGVGEVVVQVKNPRDHPVTARLLPGFAEAGTPFASYEGWTLRETAVTTVPAFQTQRWVVVVQAPIARPAPEVHLHVGVASEDGSWFRMADGALDTVTFGVGQASPAARTGCMSAGFEHGFPRDAGTAGTLDARDFQLDPPPPDWLGGEEGFFEEDARAFDDARTHGDTRAPAPPREPGRPAAPVVAAGVAAAGIGSVGAALVAWRTDWGRWRLLPAFAGLYSRLAKHRVLEQGTRDALYARVKAQPGIHLIALRDALGISTTLAVHHLRMLERHGLITSRREGRWRRFYPIGEKVPAPQAAPLTELQQRIVQLARERGGIEYGDVIEVLGVSKQRVSYNVKVLSEMGLARLERDATGRYVVVAIASA